MMGEIEITDKVRYIFDVCLSSGYVKTIGDAGALHELYKAIETSMLELQIYRQSAEQARGGKMPS